MRKCRSCLVEKDYSEYYSKYYKDCKPCHIQKIKQNQAQRSKYYGDYRKKYKAAHPEQVKEWKEASIRRWEERHGKSYKDHLKEKTKLRRQSSKYKSAELIKKKLRKAMLYKQRLLIAKQMLRYWEKRLKTLLQSKRFKP